MTAEDPVEYYLEGIGQVQANEKIGLSFSTILRAFCGRIRKSFWWGDQRSGNRRYRGQGCTDRHLPVHPAYQ